MTSCLCTTVFTVAVAVFLPGFSISKFLLFSDTDDGPLRLKWILVFNILILNELTDFVLVQIVSTIYEIYPQSSSGNFLVQV